MCADWSSCAAHPRPHLTRQNSRPGRNRAQATPQSGCGVVRMTRLLIVLLLLAGLSSAQAQPPWGYVPYGGPYAAPAPRGPPVSLARAMLDAHNAARNRVGVPPLAWSAQLAAVAQDWANHLIAVRGFAHRPNNRYGENLYAISG